MLLVLVGGVVSASAADPSFLGNSAINVNETWYYAGHNLSWCTGGAFDNADLGTITTLAIGGKSEAYDSGNNWGSGVVTMGYKIDGGSDHSLNLIYYTFESNNNIFQSGGTTFTSTEIDLSGLSCGEHSIEVWFSCGQTYDSNNSNNYKAKFTIASSYTRENLTVGNFGTICLPYAATVTGATVFEITGKVMEGNTLKGINLSSVDNLVAGRAYIFKATGTTLTATLSGNYTDALTDEAMVGNISQDKLSVPAGKYIVGSDNKIHPAGDHVVVGQYKAYIDIAKVSESSAPSFDFIGVEETTGIEGLEMENTSDAIYNLQGQRVSNIQKGMYIINGKKVLVK